MRRRAAHVGQDAPRTGAGGAPGGASAVAARRDVGAAPVTPHARTLAALLRVLHLDARHLRRADDVTAWLAEALYQRYFIGWHQPPRPRDDYAGEPGFVAELLARTAGATTWEAGFTVQRRTRQGSFVANDDVRLWVTDDDGLWPARARAGQRVAVRLPCAREAAIPGFFTVVSRAGRLQRDEAHLKLYLNLAPAAVPSLLDGLVSAPTLRRARFEAKVGNEPSHYGRRDTALVYVAPRDYRRVADWVLAFRARHPRAFRRASPPMTWPLAPGVSAAESPVGVDESFGAHRCRLLAEAVVAARRTGAPWPHAVAARFAAEGLDWQRPWLGQLPARWTRAPG